MAVRVSPHLSKSAHPAFSAKLDLIRTSISSLVDTGLNGLTPYLYILLDKCPPAYRSALDDVLSRVEHEYLTVEEDESPWHGNSGTFRLQMRLLYRQNHSKNLFFVEDDYVFVDRVSEMLSLLDAGEADFVSPYDHPWLSSEEWKGFVQERLVTQTHTWFAAPFATMTFMTRKDVVFSSWALLDRLPSLGDMGIFLILTRSLKPFDPFSPCYRLRLGILARGLKQYFRGRSYKLLYPQPTIAAHMVETLPPGPSWTEVLDEYSVH